MSDTTTDKPGRFADLVDAIHKWWNTKHGGEDEHDSRREVGEEVTRLLPDPVNATSAVHASRKRRKLADDALAQGDD